MPDQNVAISLTPDEALVLFEFASRFTDSDALALEHTSERVALWNLTALLEKVLAAPLQPDYNKQLAAARERLAEDYETEA